MDAESLTIKLPLFSLGIAHTHKCEILKKIYKQRVSVYLVKQESEAWKSMYVHKKTGKFFCAR